VLLEQLAKRDSFTDKIREKEAGPTSIEGSESRKNS